ncbi:MAG: BTAD domain-containing putative transcriptional regulator [Chloroflexota bacterium]
MFSHPMRHDEALLRTKLVPPQIHRRVLSRPALLERLHEALDARLTIVQAGTGYSKTTALASLRDTSVPLYWYSIGEADADPQRFLAYLAASFRGSLADFAELPAAVLHERGPEASRDAAIHAVDALINALHHAITEPSILVLDDFHLVAHIPEINKLAERFVSYLPHDLHVIIATRYPLDWSSLAAWRARGELLDIGRRSLAFSDEEAGSLFRDVYRITLSDEELAVLIDRTEGWPIALQLVWQGLRDDTPRSAGSLLEAGSSVQTLFDYLAKEVIGSQSPEIAHFLLESSVLRELTPASCDAVTGRSDSEAMLQHLLELDLFVVDLGGGHYRYHHLFHDFLREQARADGQGIKVRQTRAAEYFEARGDYEEAIYHRLALGDTSRAALGIEKAGDAALAAGWLNTVAAWMDALPSDVVQERPLLQAFHGDIFRLRSRFDEALEWYARAEALWRERNDRAGVSRALRGQALVYLDTVRPAQAESILQEALSLTEGTDERVGRALILESLAENKLNMGKADEAEALRVQARTLRDEGPGEDALSVRVKLRTGRLDEAQRILESWADKERRETETGRSHAPRAHRETMLMLSLITALMGRGERAFVLAEEGIDLGGRLYSPFVTAVGHTRLGHAWQLRLNAGEDAPGEQAYEGAIRCYETGVALGDLLSVRRLRAEVMWGMTRAYGFSGDIESAERAAAEGVATGKWAGDAWIVALIELMLGASYLLAGRVTEAVEILPRVLVAFRECGDSLGQAATHLWLGMAYANVGQAELSAGSIEGALTLCEAHGYDFLFTSHSFLGPPDPRRLVPLLLEARNNRHRVTYVARLLAEAGLPDIQVHPGYRLRVTALGGFHVIRGTSEIEARDWQRDKARQLFQLLLTQRGRWLQRDEIVEKLWPSLSPDAALRDFKVALNALNKAIEPFRGADAPFAYIERDGASYRIRPEADVWLDAEVFEQECLAGQRQADAGMNSAAVERLKGAMQLYTGNYLPDALYDDWASDERERLLSIYMRSADRLAGLLVERADYDGALDMCGRMLAQDPTWEGAYRWTMLAHSRQGNRSLALRAYQRCVQAMQSELGVEPSPSLKALYGRLMQDADL